MTPAPSLFPQPIRANVRPSGSYLAFAAVHAPQGSIAELLVKLAGPISVEETTQLLEEVLLLIDRAAEEGKAHLVGDAICALVAGEEAREGAGQKRAYAMALRRTNKPRLLRMVAALLPRHREKADEYTAVLARMGQDGADAAIEELTAAQSLGDRRIFFDTLVKLKASIPALIHMLGDPRWYVVRNAADLLGELPTAEAEGPLVKLLKHDDERVRRAAAASLAKIGTGNAFVALRLALRNSSAQVRLVAAAGLAAWKRNTSAHSLTVALDQEADGDVQLQIIETLGRVATPDAVRRLIELAEPGGVVFGRKSSTHRLAAVEALGAAGSAAAVAALQTLTGDKDRAVRDAAAAVVKTVRRAKASA
jgi:HEAT repeat protein